MPRWNVRSVLYGLAVALPLLALVACGHAIEGAGSVSATGPTHGVVVEVSASSYATTDTIAVTVRNELGETILATDHQTSCTIVQLQLQTNGDWQNQGGCALGLATRRIPLSAGSVTPAHVSPTAGQMTAKPWPAGTYRVAFTYQIVTTGTPGGSETVYSAPFTVS